MTRLVDVHKSDKVGVVQYLMAHARISTAYSIDTSTDMVDTVYQAAPNVVNLLRFCCKIVYIEILEIEA